MSCVLSCPSRLPHDPERWCASCQAEHERWLDDMGQIAALAVLARLVEDYVPASDREWADRLDDVAPLVEDLSFTVHDAPPE